MKKLTLPDKVYKVLKWLLLIVVPAFNTLLTVLTETWGWDIPLKAIVTTISAVAAFIGIVMGISNKNYYRNAEGDAEK